MNTTRLWSNNDQASLHLGQPSCLTSRWFDDWSATCSGMTVITTVTTINWQSITWNCCSLHWQVAALLLHVLLRCQRSKEHVHACKMRYTTRTALLHRVSAPLHKLCLAFRPACKLQIWLTFLKGQLMAPRHFNTATDCTLSDDRMQNRKESSSV